jgi:hypothetical protein
VIINITDVNDVRKAVRLRALDINGASTGINGVSILSANNVWVEDSVIDGTTGNGTTSGIGIRLASAASCNLYVMDTMIHKHVTGIRVTATTGFAVANIRNSNIEGNTTGLDVTTNGFATVEDVRFARNATNGVVTSSAGTATIRNSVFSNNGTAINAGAGTTVRSLSNILNNNTTGFGGTTAVIQTDGQNKNIANGTPGAPGGGTVTTH